MRTSPEANERWEAWKAERAAERKQARELAKFAIEADRYVFVTPVHIPCPRCGCLKLRTDRTERHEGVKSQRKTCLGCEWKFFAVFQDLES